MKGKFLSWVYLVSIIGTFFYFCDFYGIDSTNDINLVILATIIYIWFVYYISNRHPNNQFEAYLKELQNKVVSFIKSPIFLVPIGIILIILVLLDKIDITNIIK